MSHTSCITHPARMRVACLREDYLTICDGHHCAAFVLSYLEHRHNQRLDLQPQARYQNRVAEDHGEPPTQDMSLWQHHTEAELRQALFGLYCEKTIREAIRFLEDCKGFVQTGYNPNPRYRFDQTTYFLFLQPQVQAALDAAYPPVAVQPEKMPDGSGKRTAPAGKNAGTRSESSFQEIRKEEEPSLNGSQREPLTGIPQEEQPEPERTEHRVLPTPSTALIPRHTSPCDPALEEVAASVLAYLNQVSGHHYGDTDLAPALAGIKARLKAHATHTDCYLVIEWYQQVRLHEWEHAYQYFDPDTLFRPRNFTKYLGRAKLWDQHGRPPTLAKIAHPRSRQLVAAGRRAVERAKAAWRTEGNL